jgi:hypothetical protein
MRKVGDIIHTSGHAALYIWNISQTKDSIFRRIVCFPCKILRAVIGRYGYSSWFFYLCSYWSESYSFWGQAGPRVCVYSIHCTKHLYSRITVQGHSWCKHCSWLNLARIKKKRAPCFLTFCYLSKNERAKAFPSFSHGLHLKRTWPRYYSSLALGRGGYIYAQ